MKNLLLELPDKEWIANLPKFELHVHFSGSIPVYLMKKLAKKRVLQLSQREKGIFDELLSKNSISEIAEFPEEHFRGCRKYDCLSYFLSNLSTNKINSLLRMTSKTYALNNFIDSFKFTDGVLYDPEALEEGAYELCRIEKADNVRYFEVRLSPTNYTCFDMNLTEIIEAVNLGLKRGEKDFGVSSGIVLVGKRNDPVQVDVNSELAIIYKHKNIVGFDLAGPIEDKLPEKFYRDIDRLLDNYVNITSHSGMFYGEESVFHSLYSLRASRISHSIMVHEDKRLTNHLKNLRICLEMCPTSDLHSGAIRKYSDHPLKKYLDSGLRVTVNTDNRTISDINLNREILKLVRSLKINKGHVLKLISNSAKSLFLDYDTKRFVYEELHEELKTILPKGEFQEYMFRFKHRKYS